LTCTK